MPIRLSNPTLLNPYDALILEGKDTWTLCITEVHANKVYHLGHYRSQHDLHTTLLNLMATNNWIAHEIDYVQMMKDKAFEDFYDSNFDL